MKIDKKRRIVYWIPVIAIMLLIFYMSSKPATQSREISSGVVQIIIIALEKVFTSVQLDVSVLHFMVRKCAHFGIYLLLGIFCNLAIRQYILPRLRCGWIAFMIAVVYAATDEFHQLFVTGRSCELRDVLIDSMGALLGILLNIIIINRKTRSL